MAQQKNNNTKTSAGNTQAQNGQASGNSNSVDLGLNTAGSTADWLKTIAEARKQSRNAFDSTIVAADAFTDDQLEQQAREFITRFKRAIERAKADRSNYRVLFLSAMRNWSRGKAIDVLRGKLAGHSIRQDYAEVFEQMLSDEIAFLISDLEQAWQTTDERKLQQVLAYRQSELKATFEQDHEPLIQAYNALQSAYTSRENAINAGYDIAGKFADKLETRMQRHEQFLEHMGGEVLGLVRDARAQQRRDDTVSMAEQIIRGAKSTFGALFWIVVSGLVTFVGLYFLLVLAFHH